MSNGQYLLSSLGEGHIGPHLPQIRFKKGGLHRNIIAPVGVARHADHGSCQVSGGGGLSCSPGWLLAWQEHSGQLVQPKYHAWWLFLQPSPVLAVWLFNCQICGSPHQAVGLFCLTFCGPTSSAKQREGILRQVRAAGRGRPARHPGAHAGPVGSPEASARAEALRRALRFSSPREPGGAFVGLGAGGPLLSRRSWRLGLLHPAGCSDPGRPRSNHRGAAASRSDEQLREGPSALEH